MRYWWSDKKAARETAAFNGSDWVSVVNVMEAADRFAAAYPLESQSISARRKKRRKG
jgi:hypothetical protein